MLYKIWKTRLKITYLFLFLYLFIQDSDDNKEEMKTDLSALFMPRQPPMTLEESVSCILHRINSSNVH